MKLKAIHTFYGTFLLFCIVNEVYGSISQQEDNNWRQKHFDGRHQAHHLHHQGDAHSMGTISKARNLRSKALQKRSQATIFVTASIIVGLVLAGGNLGYAQVCKMNEERKDDGSYFTYKEKLLKQYTEAWTVAHNVMKKLEAGLDCEDIADEGKDDIKELINYMNVLSYGYRHADNKEEGGEVVAEVSIDGGLQKKLENEYASVVGAIKMFKDITLNANGENSLTSTASLYGKEEVEDALKAGTSKLTQVVKNEFVDATVEAAEKIMSDEGAEVIDSLAEIAPDAIDEVTSSLNDFVDVLSDIDLSDGVDLTGVGLILSAGKYFFKRADNYYVPPTLEAKANKQFGNEILEYTTTAASLAGAVCTGGAGLIFMGSKALLPLINGKDPGVFNKLWQEEMPALMNQWYADQHIYDYTAVHDKCVSKGVSSGVSSLSPATPRNVKASIASAGAPPAA